MTQERIERARDFILKNARLLERQLFAYHFEDQPPHAALKALLAYQNADGGFGNALEPDKRVPASQPQDVEVAFRTLDEIGLMRGDFVMPVLDWLMKITTPEGGVPFSLPSANGYPRAPWWAVAVENPPADLNPTAAILGLVHKHNGSHPWIERASEFCFRAIEASESTSLHEIACSSIFLQHSPDRGRAAKLLSDMVGRVMAPGVVEHDPAATGYVKKPLDFAPRADSPFRPIFKDSLIEEHLAALAAQQEEDGGWPISWEPISEGVRLEWRGRVTIEALQTLRSYGA